YIPTLVETFPGLEKVEDVICELLVLLHVSYAYQDHSLRPRIRVGFYDAQEFPPPLHEVNVISQLAHGYLPPLPLGGDGVADAPRVLLNPSHLSPLPPLHLFGFHQADVYATHDAPLPSRPFVRRAGLPA